MKFSYTTIVTTKEFSFIYIELSLQWVSVLLVDFFAQHCIKLIHTIYT